MNTAVFVDLVVVFASALVIGTIVRYVVPGRIKHGLLLIPGFAIVFSLLVWEIGVWAGLSHDVALPAWLILLVVASGATTWFTFWLIRRRNASDETALTSALANIRSL